MKSTPITMFRQGDVLLISVNEIPKGAAETTERDPGRIVLAYGEVTGHAHAIYEPLTKATPDGKARIWDAGAERFLQVLEVTSVRHEEHAPVSLAPGVYKVVRQVEYTPEEIRRVAD